MELLSYWFEGTRKKKLSRWFGKDIEIDKIIYEKYGSLVKKEFESKLIVPKTVEEGLIKVILLDQLSRHIMRYSDDISDIDLYLEKACYYSDYIISKKWDQELLPEQIIFILMPYRHQETLIYMQKIFERFAIYSDDIKSNKLFQNFIKVTNKKWLELNYHKILSNITLSSEIFDYDYDKILENPVDNPFKKKFNFPIEKTAIHTIIKSFIRNYYPDTTIILSLSGGVDSMVLLYALLFIRRETDINIIAIHIDYSNREESIFERMFLETLCAYLNIPFYAIVIDHIKRGITDREVYEVETRRIRYDSYNKLVNKYSSEGVWLGHQLEDKVENIFTNCMNGRSILDLSVLHPTSIVCGVTIFRPLLEISKEQLFEIAHSYRIPYFKNTTPIWSNRGILREKIMPMLYSRYGSECVKKNILRVGKTSREWELFINKKFIKPFIEECYIEKIGISIPILEYKDFPLVFWESVFLELFHKAGWSMISHKSLEQFMISLENKTKKEYYLSTLKRDRIAFWTKERCYIIKNFKQIDKLVRTKLEYPCSINYNNWNISIKKFDHLYTNYPSYHNFLDTEQEIICLPVIKGKELVVSSEWKKCKKKYTIYNNVCLSFVKKLGLPFIGMEILSDKIELVENSYYIIKIVLV